VRALAVAAGVIDAALADLPVPVDGDLPACSGTRLIAVFSRSPSAHPTGVDQLVPGPGGELIRVLDQVMAGSAPSQATISGGGTPAAAPRSTASACAM
jgi:hypothetical protein